MRIAEEHAVAFEDFIRNFKSDTEEAEDALKKLNLNENGTDDEYDFMDESDDGEAARKSSRRQHSKSGRKYMDMLQSVADREISHITIELDDLDTVRSAADEIASSRCLQLFSTRRVCRKMKRNWI